MRKLVATLLFPAALLACAKGRPKGDSTPKPAVVATAPNTSPDPDGWTEHEGPGFVVTAPRAPTAREETTASGQPMSFLIGYEPDGFQGSFQIATTKPTDAAADPATIVENGVSGMLERMPGALVTKNEPLPGHDLGRALVADGNHPQAGPFHITAKIFFHAERIYVVQALYAAPKDAALASRFVDSFKFVD